MNTPNPSPHTRTFRLPADFPLESGATLSEVVVAYRTWGTLQPGGDNAVLVCHALTGSADVEQWWPALLGPGRTLDPERAFIVCSNVLGGCYGTTGPTSPRPGSHTCWGPDFPAITIRDMVRLQRQLLAELGVRRLQLVIGGSLGGMQALEWAVSFPELVERAAVIAAPARHSAWATALSEAQRAAIRADARFRHGRYPPSDPPRAGLAAARMMAMCTYRSPASLAARFDRATTPDGSFLVERYLRAHGERLVARFDANTYITLTYAMDSHDVGRGRGGCRQALAALPMPVLVVGIDSDVLYPVSEVHQLAQAIPQARWAVLASPHGHDAFLVEAEAVAALTRQFLAAGANADPLGGVRCA
ncbi:MAG: homoserine O-acetyltransferase [Thermoanaerobaculaceae bacterium]|nr:homoserine O-acetyltransferase [Thermoanaerobaculaceae bacterium]